MGESVTGRPFLFDGDTFAVDSSWLPNKSTRGCVAREWRARIRPTWAAVRLGIPRSTLESKIRALKIDKSLFRAVATKSA